MHTLLIYDIPDDRARQKVADACLDYGLQRIQYSAFSGQLSRTLQRALFSEIKQRLGRNEANIQLIAIDPATWQARRQIVQGGKHERDS
jgi:CRISPR-associated endoribonuclease Cas2